MIMIVLGWPSGIGLGCGSVLLLSILSGANLDAIAEECTTERVSNIQETNGPNQELTTKKPIGYKIWQSFESNRHLLLSLCLININLIMYLQPKQKIGSQTQAKKGKGITSHPRIGYSI
ncbi:transmembrane protein, putative [Medicago truncatula]|uniref:Transmembrane protein, putative n=1 Tax=Medicago truncatula TaxID=3880 RepID=G7JQN0_MEDTR|nr:transmembrane protein, putative [Medicago truncatula]